MENAACKVEIGMKVKINEGGCIGKVTGIWKTEYDMQFMIQYSDKTGAIHEFWLHVNDFKIIK